ncbi:MAG: adenylosuccinate lyase [Spirochaetes bacterium]|nr:adenylosuccinate lyase [Spirochaetota bacterium]MBU0956450.1 adenylosuccinate lyase [Spirochaetota bacterium]
MQPRDIFHNISPLDHRYWAANEALFNLAAEYLSEDASVRYCARAEMALVKAHLSSRGRASEQQFRKLDEIVTRLDVNAVYKEEETTRHNIRALVNVLMHMMPADIAPLVHLGATSVDILDTAQSARLRDVSLDVVLPLLAELLSALCTLAEREADTPQVGRTHGQHAVPITYGFAVAEYVARLGKCLPEIEARARDLRGKLAGATGSYNALSMSYADPQAVEQLYLSNLGLTASEHSTQLVEPEHLLRLLLELNTAFGIIANLADDLRNLQRSEIDEVREGFSSGQVGSSTMPQKRNPWNSEHVKSLWKAFAPRVMTFYMDQISEHQRDLTNSASSRFVADYIAGFLAAVNRMLSVLKSLGVNRQKMLDNLASGGGSVLAEPSYILLAETGIAEAHEIVRNITLCAEKEKLSFGQALAKYPEAEKAIFGKLSELGYDNPADFFANPQKYNGRSAHKARELAAKYQELSRRYLKSKEQAV